MARHSPYQIPFEAKYRSEYKRERVGSVLAVERPPSLAMPVRSWCTNCAGRTRVHECDAARKPASFRGRRAGATVHPICGRSPYRLYSSSQVLKRKSMIALLQLRRDRTRAICILLPGLVQNLLTSRRSDQLQHLDRSGVDPATSGRVNTALDLAEPRSGNSEK